MVEHDEANRLLDCFENGDREAYRQTLDRIKQDHPESRVRDIRALAEREIRMYRGSLSMSAWRYHWRKQR